VAGDCRYTSNGPTAQVTSCEICYLTENKGTSQQKAAHEGGLHSAIGDGSVVQLSR